LLDVLKDKFRIVFSIDIHPYFGLIMECHAVKVSDKGKLMLASQKIHTTTAADFGLTEKQVRLVTWLDEIEKHEIIKKFNTQKKPVKPNDFFAKQYNEVMHNKVRPFIEKRLVKALELLEDESIFLASKDHNTPAYKRLLYPTEKSTVLFHLFRNENTMHYFATIKYEDKKIEYSQNGALLITQEPVWMLVNNQLLNFENNIDGKKFTPFIAKKFIEIPKRSEKMYLEKFIVPLIEKYDVFAKGIDIVTEKLQAAPILQLVKSGKSLSLTLSFQYGIHRFNYNTKKLVNAILTEKNGQFTIKRIKRSAIWEEQKKKVLEECGFVHNVGASFGVEKTQTLFDNSANGDHLMELLIQAKDNLLEAGFIIEQNLGKESVLIDEPKINIETKDKSDYFDVKITVEFGKFTIPFVQLRQHILTQNAYYKLPDGTFGFIPSAWFTQFLPLVDFSEVEGENLLLKKHHAAIVEGLVSEEKEQKVTFDIKNATDVYLPKSFKATLRKYQDEGFKWMTYLKSIHCGGILADDMGLGKTVQALAFLTYHLEQSTDKVNYLILAPTSLIYNWQNEIAAFCPHLKTLVYGGNNRDKNITGLYAEYDIIICSYGIFRSDIAYFSQVPFAVIVADESQTFKNKSSLLYKALKTVNAEMIIGLTGTPIENSVRDLWSQMDIINPKMLGSYNYFKRVYADPIEKKEDKNIAKQLQELVNPFVLRRTKNQVMQELPVKSEFIVPCEMTENQAELYEQVKSYYRNQLLNIIHEDGFEASRIKILAGIMKLRQIANHPQLAGYEDVNESGKFDAICAKIETAINSGHKLLFFSQFLGQLGLVRDFLESMDIDYAYIDGSVNAKNRALAVEKFQTNATCKVFLLSIKAGDKGLNLTAADYVLIADPWWNPAVEMQAQDRAHRIGQQKPVFIYRFISKNTIEDKIIVLQNKKKTLAKNIISENETIKSLLTKDNFASFFELEQKKSNKSDK